MVRPATIAVSGGAACRLRVRTCAGPRLALLARSLLLVLLAWPACAQLNVRDLPLPTDTDVQYGPAPSDTLDVYRRPGAAPAPLIVFLHGGGWRGGDKNVGRKVAPPLVQHGYVVASLNYRIAPPTTPAQEVQDAALGAAYLLHNAARFGILPGRFVVMGHSSGGHMAALLGVDSSYLRQAGVDPGKLAAVVSLDGVYDVQANLTDFPNERREAVFGDDPAAWKLVSPVALLDRMQGHPRFCVAHDDVKRRFVEQAGLFAAALKTHGVAAEILAVPGIGHAAIAGRFAYPDMPMAPFVLKCLATAFAGT